MPTYQGGKAKIGKEIANVVEEFENEIGWKGKYFEPFCGMLGVGIHFAKQKRKVYMCDNNKDLMLMWQAIKKGWNPPKKCSKEKYEKLKKSKTHSAERGYIGIGCSYSGIFFTGYRMESGGKNFLDIFRRGILDYKKHLKYVKFMTPSSYEDFEPNGYTIYCDPPYEKNTIRTEHFQGFNHKHFWDVMKRWSKNNLVFISEYSAPKDFVAIWEKSIKSTYNAKQASRKEKVFVHKRYLK